MKSKALLLAIVLCITLLAGCNTSTPAPSPSPAASPTPSATPPQTAPAETTPDVKTSASIVNTEAAFDKAISNTGTWIIATVKDLTFTKDLVLDGEFKNGKKDSAGKDIIQRKIALYAQDENRKVTARYTLTAPKLTINSPKAGLWYGTFKGDIYVNAKDFSLIGATVDGNVYFMNADAKGTFKPDADSKITGKQELKK
jgi:glucose/arabinose dehydrogenase